jgi:hypothetical protein
MKAAHAPLGQRLQPDPPVAPGTPVVPGADEARRWATEELAKPVYQLAQPNWVEELWARFVDWLEDLLNDVPGAEGGGAQVFLVLAMAALIAFAVTRVRLRMNAKAKKQPDVFDDALELTAHDYRERAAEAARLDDWKTAVIEQFRALVRAAEERAVIGQVPGRTADEAALQLGFAFREAAPGLRRAAELFDAVRYGHADADAEDHSLIAALDRDLDSLRPEYPAEAASAVQGSP